MGMGNQLVIQLLVRNAGESEMSAGTRIETCWERVGGSGLGEV